MGRIINQYVSEAYQGSQATFEDADEGTEAVIAADQAADVVANDATMDQVYAMQDNAENMSATADFIDANVNTRDGGATEGEVGLAEQVADLATQGTGDSSEQVMPAAESYVGSKIATEGFRETVRNITQAIKRMLRTVFERLKRFWKKMFGRCKPIMADAQKLAARAKAAGGKHLNDKTMEVGSTIATACVWGKKVERSVSQVLSHFEKNADMLLKDMYGSALKQNLDLGEALVDALNDIDGTADSVKSGIDKLVSVGEAKYKSFVSSFASDSVSDKRFESSSHDVKASSEILGGKRFFAQLPRNGSVSKARALVDSRVYFANSVKDQPTFDTATIEIPQLSTIEKLAGVIEDTAKEVHRFETGKGFRDQERIRNRVEAAADKLANRKVADEDRADGLATNLRVAASFGTLYTTMCQHPYTPMASHMCSIMRSLLSLGERSVSEYTNASN